MIVLDTNVLSELMRSRPAPAVGEWMDAQIGSEVCVTAVTVAEVLYGIARLPEGHRKSALVAGMQGAVDDEFDERVLAFDRHCTHHYADIVASRQRAGRPIGWADAQIAAICRSRAAVLATRNVRDFEGTGVAVVDPWTDGDR